MGRFFKIITLLTVVVILSVATSWATTEAVTSFAPAASAFGSTGGTGAINVTSSGAWTAHTDDSWITITSPTSFSSDGSISYTVASNETGFERTGSIKLGGQMFIVRQARTDLTDNVDPSSWSQQSINAIYAAGITVGCGNNSFCKADPVTREQMAAFLVRAVIGEDFSFTQQPYFADVPATAWSFKYVQKLKDLGLTASTGTYNNVGSVTREQMAAFLVRAKLGENFSYPTTPYFSDVPDTSWSFKYVQKLKELGYTTATGSYAAAEPVTREQMAAFLARVFLGMTSTYTISYTDSPLNGTYQGTAVIQGDTGPIPIATFVLKVDGSGTVTGMLTDLSDNNRQYPFGGTANVGTGTMMFGFNLAEGNRITISGTPESGRWTRSENQNNPAASGTYTATKTTSQNGFTSELLSGKTFQFAGADAESTVYGLMAFHADGTFLSTVPFQADSSGQWSINPSGQLVADTTGGPDSGQTDVITLTSSTGTSFSGSDAWSSPGGHGTGEFTFTPYLSGFTSDLISGKTFHFTGTDAEGTVTGTMAFHADGTFVLPNSSGNWSINSAGQLVLNTVGGPDSGQIDVVTLISTSGTTITASDMWKSLNDYGSGVFTLTP